MHLLVRVRRQLIVTSKLYGIGRKQRNYKKLMAKMGDFKGMSPDEIKVKLNQIYDWNDKK